MASKDFETAPSRNLKSKTKFFGLNYQMLPYKMHFFLFLGAMSCVLPYKTVFAKSRLGMSGTEIATLYTTLQFIVILTKPAIGALVDYFNKLKLVIVTLTIAEVTFFLLLLAIPPVDRTSSLMGNATNHSNRNVIRMIHKMHSFGDIYVCFSNGTMFECLQHDYSFFYAEKQDSNITFPSKCILKHNGTSSSFMDTIELCEIQDKDFENFLWDFIPDSTVSSLGNCLESTFNETVVNLHDSSFFNCFNESRSFQLFMIPPKVFSLEDGVIKDKHLGSLYGTYQFWLFAFCTMCASIATNALFTLSDTACYECLDKTGADYGRQRLWGAISWGLLAPFTGFLNDIASKGSSMPDYSPGFYLMIVLAAMQIINIWRLDLEKPNISRSFFKDIKTVFSSTEFLVFEMGVFMIGLFTGFIWFYLLVFVESIGGNRLVMGLVHASQCFLGELPFMMLSGWLVKKIGHINVLTFSFLFFAIRFGSYSSIHNPWYVIPVEFTHGLTYGVFYTAMTAFGKLSSRPGTEATTQAILCCTYEGLGAGVGCILAGIGFDRLGSEQTFRIASISSFCMATIYGLATLFMHFRRRSTKIRA